MVILIDAERTPGYSVYTSSKAKSILSNFDVHNDYNEPIDNFELELYGPWVPNDVTWWFPGWGGEYLRGSLQYQAA